jgi:hypothetical protein
MSGHAFTRSIEAPRSGSCCLYAGCRLGGKTGDPQADPRTTARPWFRHRLMAFDTSTAEGLSTHRSSSRPPPDAIKPRLFPTTFSTTVFSQCTCGRFEASPRRATPEGQTTSITSTAPRSAGPPSALRPASCVRVHNAVLHHHVLLVQGAGRLPGLGRKTAQPLSEAQSQTTGLAA